MRADKLFLVTFLAFVTSNLGEVKGQQLGKASKIPDTEVTTLKGNKVKLSNELASDKYTIISFWATWCKPCKKELSNLSYLLPKWKKQYDVELLAISLDNSQTSRKVKSYVNGKGWQFDVLLDPNNNTKRQLNFNAIPYSMIVDKNGKIIYKHSGYKSGDEYAMKDELKKASNSEDQ